MCGICGKIYFNQAKIKKEDIQRMNQKIAHRGPDDSGVYLSPHSQVGLGHQRFSILDLSSQGHQPMNYLNRYWIVFNGEIYNYQEKIHELQKEGYSFKSKTDTEVILALYDKYKKNCLNHLRGMFAFVIYDKKENTLFCARDRIGQKPFKYYLDNQVFIFASELKAILTQKDYQKEPDYLAIHHYLTLQYCPTPLTGFKNIQKLEPAHYLWIDIAKRKIEKKCYWKLNFNDKWDLSDEEWQVKILNKLEEAVRLRLISDVPLGAFLSGGLDSSAVVALMSKLSPKPVKTFSIGFSEKKYNETPYARQIAKQFKTDHQEFTVKPQAMEILPKLVRQYEEPYADSSALPTYYLSELTRKYVTVALTGDGGDENFAGYSRYSIQKFSLFYEKLLFFHQLLVTPANKLLAELRPCIFSDRLKRFSSTLQEDYKKRYGHYICYFNNPMKNDLYTDKFRTKIKDEAKNNQNNKLAPNNFNIDTFELIADYFSHSQAQDKMDQILAADINTYLVDDLMTKVDIASMAVSLEARSPFLDHEFMELTAKIPSNLKLKGFNQKKYLLKKSLEKILPQEIIHRKKQGFRIPIDSWFLEELKEYTHSKLLSPRAKARNCFNYKKIKNILDSYKFTQLDLACQIWALLTLELWFQEYFD